MHLGISGSFSFIHHVHVAIMHVHGYTCMMSFVNFLSLFYHFINHCFAHTMFPNMHLHIVCK